MKKKLSLLLLLLLIPTLAYAVGTMLMAGGVPSGCSTPNNGDEMDEGFLAAGYELGAAWSETIGSGDTVDEDANLPGSPPTNNCSEGLRINASESLSYAKWDRGSTFARAGDLDVVVELYIDAATLDNNSSSDTITWESTLVAGVQLYNDGGTLSVRGTGSTNSTAVAITTGAWHIIKLHMDGTAASSYMQLDGGAQNTFTRADTVDGRYLKLGSIWGVGAGESVDIYFGYVYINSS